MGIRYALVVVLRVVVAKSYNWSANIVCAERVSLEPVSPNWSLDHFDLSDSKNFLKLRQKLDIKKLVEILGTSEIGFDFW